MGVSDSVSVLLLLLAGLPGCEWAGVGAAVAVGETGVEQVEDEADLAAAEAAFFSAEIFLLEPEPDDPAASEAAAPALAAAIRVAAAVVAGERTAVSPEGRVMMGVAVEVMIPAPSFLILGLFRCRWNWRMSSWTEASSR